MAGWGGYDTPADEALSTFLEAFESGALERELYTFDLAAVAIPPQRAEPDTSRMEDLVKANALLRERMREIGFDRVVYGTDWNALPLRGYMMSLRETLSLTPEELADVMDNVGPLVR